MGKLAKTSTYAGGSGLIVGSGVVIEEYFMEDSGENISFAPTTPVVVDVVDGETVEKVLKDMGLNLASNLADFQKIFNDLRSNGIDSWTTGIISYADWNRRKPTPSDMQKKCLDYGKKRFSDFQKKGDNGDTRRQNELKTIKIVCTTNYSITDNAKDHWGEDKTIHKDTSIDATVWKVQIQKFNEKHKGKSTDDMKRECEKIGQHPYRTNPPNRNDFYAFCVRS